MVSADALVFGAALSESHFSAYTNVTGRRDRVYFAFTRVVDIDPGLGVALISRTLECLVIEPRDPLPSVGVHDVNWLLSACEMC